MNNRHPKDDLPSSQEAPAPQSRTRRRDPGLLTWVEVVRFVRRNLWVILGASVGLSVLVLLILVLFRPPTYQGVATLVIAPQGFSPELKTATALVEEYQRLLESNAVVAETAKRLRSEGVLKAAEPLRVGDEIRSAVVVSPRADVTTLSPIIEVTAEASTPEAAAAMANAWSEVFLEHAGQIQEDNMVPMIDLIEGQYQGERARLLDLRENEARLATEYQARLDELSLTWDRKLVGASKHTEDLAVQHKIETRRAMEEFAAGAGLALATESSLEGIGEWGRYEPPGEVEKKLLQILSLRAQLAQTPRLLVLEKTISDNSLWQMMALTQGQMKDHQSVLDRRLVTHETNALYDQLTLRLSEIETELDSIPSNERYRIHRFSADLERLQAERVADLAKLLSDRALLVNDLERQRSRELQAVERERKLQLDQIRADIGRQANLFTKLAETRDQAGFAQAGQALREARLAAPAGPPGAPEPQGIGFMALVAAFVGGLLGLVISLAREAG